MFGGITVVCGILGNLGGGFLLDFMNNTISNTFNVGIWILAFLLYKFMHFLNCSACIITLNTNYSHLHIWSDLILADQNERDFASLKSSVLDCSKRLGVYVVVSE